MNWTTLIITIMSSTFSHNIKQTMQNDQLVFNGFNCRVPKKIVSLLTKEWCQPAKSSGKNALGEKKTVTAYHKDRTEHCHIDTDDSSRFGQACRS